MHYRLYLIGSNNHFSRAIDLDCENDAHAWQVVKDHAPEMPLELWQGERRVGTLSPNEEPALVKAERNNHT